jgi:hypothetical protein
MIMPSQTLYPMRLGRCIPDLHGGRVGRGHAFPWQRVHVRTRIGRRYRLCAIIGLRKAAAARSGRPTRKQVQIVTGAIALEFSAIYLLSVSGILKGASFLTIWQVILGVVALHFIPMRWTHGPLILALAFTNLAWIGICVLAGLSIGPLFLGDGLLKIVFGAVMAALLLTSANFKPQRSSGQSRT